MLLLLLVLLLVLVLVLLLVLLLLLRSALLVVDDILQTAMFCAEIYIIWQFHRLRGF
jgi:hypothetical protein